MSISGKRKFDPSVHKIKIRIKVKPQHPLSYGLSSKHARQAASDFLQHSCKESDPPDVDGTDQMLSPGKKSDGTKPRGRRLQAVSRQK